MYNLGFNRADEPVPCADPERPGKRGGLLLLIQDDWSWDQTWVEAGCINDGTFETYDVQGDSYPVSEEHTVIGWRDFRLTNGERQEL